MTLVATIMAVVIFAAVVLTEVQAFANILEALSTGVERTTVVKKEEKVNWKEAYVTR